jgi:uncharacterized protein YbaA (DUF1428 family)
MSYVDGFVIPVPKANKEAFIAHANTLDPVFKEYGALAVVECWADDVPEGKVTDFYRAVQCGPDETVVFSWVIWPDKQTRDKGNAAIMADPRMQGGEATAPFDGKRLIYGGFQTIVSL